MADLKKFKVNESKVVHDTIDGEVILIHMDSGNYYSIDQIGADIWNLIRINMTTQQIIDDLLLRYEGTAEEISKSVNLFVSQLNNEALIVFDDDTGDLPPNTNPQYNKSITQAKSLFISPVLEIYSDMQDLLLLDPIHEVDEKGWPNASK